MADTLDVLSLIEGYRAIADRTSADSGTGPQDARLAQIITSVSRILDQEIGPVVNRTVTEEHPGLHTAIWPRQTPISSVTTLKEWDGTTLTALTEDTFGTAGADDGFKIVKTGGYAHGQRIERRSGGLLAHFAREVQLVYVAGRAANTAAVDARIKEAASEILRRLNKREGGIWAASPDLLSNLDGGNVSPGFFRAVKPMIEETLHDEMKLPGLA